jgi:hypothetical protein
LWQEQLRLLQQDCCLLVVQIRRFLEAFSFDFHCSVDVAFVLVVLKEEILIFAFLRVPYQLQVWGARQGLRMERGSRLSVPFVVVVVAVIVYLY